MDRLAELAAAMREHQELCERLRSSDSPRDMMHVRATAWGEAAELVEAMVREEMCLSEQRN